jgi:hypothetical protein
MCFSAPASFATAAITGLIGLIAVAQTSQRRDLPLAIVPLVFAVQQCIEGMLWLTLPEDTGGSSSGVLVSAYLFFAQAFWPAFAPFAVLTMERGSRQRVIWVLQALGIAVSGYFLAGLLTQTHTAAIIDDHIVYATEYRFPLALGAAYLAATCLPMMISTYRTVVTLGAVIALGCAVAYLAYWQSFASVWCFFAAGASSIILAHFVTLRRSASRRPA